MNNEIVKLQKSFQRGLFATFPLTLSLSQQQFSESEEGIEGAGFSLLFPCR